QGGAGQHDDPGRPAAAEAGDDPNPAELQRGINRQQRPGRRCTRRDEQRQAEEPAAMQQNKGGITARVELEGALSAQPAGIARGENQLGQALQYDQAEHRMKQAHRWLSSAKPAVKPGPSAVISARSQASPSASACASMRSSTNNTLAADML